MKIVAETSRCQKQLPEVAVAIGGTVLEASSAIVLTTNAPQCEDCPDTNPTPPKDSLCENFDIRNGFPTCTRLGNTDEALGRWLNG